MTIAGVIGFFRSPLGRGLAIAAGALVAIGILYSRGYSAGMERCQRDRLEAELAAMARDRDIAAAAAAEGEALLASLETENRALEELVNDQTEAIAALGDADRCSWDPDQLARLRDVLGR